MTQPVTPAPTLDLDALLRLDFRQKDFGDSTQQFESRIGYAVDAANAREDVTAVQREAGARYLLLSAQIRQLTRQVEEFAAPGEISVKQGLATRLGSLRYEQEQQLRASGLRVAISRPQSVLVDVQESF